MQKTQSAAVAAESPDTAVVAAPASPEPDGRYACGTLRYTKIGLISLIFWLCWGDFTWTVMESVPGLIGLKMLDLKAPNWLMSVLGGTIPAMICLFVTPIISFRSDRARGPHGRRIPYLLWSTPFISVFLILLGLSDQITAALQISLPALLSNINPFVLALTVIGVLLAFFNFANMFVQTIFWYLFNDVVPNKFMSQFLAIFRIVGTIAGMLYGWLVFPLCWDTETRMCTYVYSYVFIGAGIIYLFGFMLMCYMVKEGKYARPPENVDKGKGIVSSLKTYFKECFTHRFYWYFFLMNFFMIVSYQTSGFSGFRNLKALHLTPLEMGQLGLITGPLGILLQYPVGYLSDKFNPFRMYVLTMFLCGIPPFLNAIWIFKDFGHDGNYALFVFINLAFMPIAALNGAADLPATMNLLPKDKFGQFSSAASMVRQIATIGTGVLGGLFMDYVIQNFYAGSDQGYRCTVIWQIFFQTFGLYFLYRLYKEWKRLGGAASYVPPRT